MDQLEESGYPGDETEDVRQEQGSQFDYGSKTANAVIEESCPSKPPRQVYVDFPSMSQFFACVCERFRSLKLLSLWAGDSDFATVTNSI
jgi:hypothetical protein